MSHPMSKPYYRVRFFLTPPELLGRLRRGGELPCEIREEGGQFTVLASISDAVTYEGVVSDPDEHLVSGVAILVMRGGFFSVLTAEQQKAEKCIQEERAAQAALATEQRLARIEERHRRDMEFNESLQKSLPFSWAPTRRIVYSGLTGNSHGDGLNRRSVTHISMLEPFSAGRLNRKTGDLLCTARSGSFGDSPSLGRVNCKRCLQIAERLKVSPKIEPDEALEEDGPCP